MLAVHDEAPGRDRDQIFERCLDPVLGLDDVEADTLCDFLAGGSGDEPAHPRLIRRVGKMQCDVPTPVRPLVPGDSGLALKKDFGKHIDDQFGGMFVANREAGTVGGGGGGHWETT